MDSDRHKRLGILALALFLVALSATSAQIWRGQGRVSGEVVDHNGEPVAGARVFLSPADAPDEGPEPVVTNRKGRWSMLGLAEGSWRLRIEAEGYQTSYGSAYAVVGPGQRVRVALRPLSEVSPSGAEGNPLTVVEWLEKGNSLLAQGRYGEAREEYRKALAVLPLPEQPQVLQAMARTYYLEQEPEKAITALKHALLIAPEDGTSRTLLVGVMEGLLRRREAETWIARLEAEGPEAMAAETEALDGLAPPTPMPEIPEAPVEPPEPHRVGRFRTAFGERSPLSAVEVFLERYDLTREEIAAVDPKAGAYDLAEETFELYVPPSYRPETPHGLFVWVSPGPYGGITRPELMAVLDEKRLIWVGANHSGNDRPRWTRIGLALDAVHAMTRLYAIDPERVYAAGYSGGGRMTSALAVVYPEVFQGGFSFFGCDYYRRVSMPHKPGAYWPPQIPVPPRAVLKLIRERNRYVLLTGEHGFNRAQTLAYYDEYRRERFRHVTYLEIPGAAHESGVPAEWLAKGIDALDAPLGKRSE